MKKFILLWVAVISMISYAKSIDITILHTTDLHGHIFPTTDYDGNEKVGGIFQLVPVIESLRAENPNNILVDNGDSLQGSLFSHINKGTPITDFFNLLDYNIWNLGNHEFDWGMKILKENLENFDGSIINANLHWAGFTPSPYKKVKPFVIEKIKGIKIAFIGLNHPDIPFWSSNFLIENSVFENPVTALFRVMPLVLEENPDAIILLVHSGYIEDTHSLEPNLKKITEIFHDIDVIIGGHSHVAIPNLMFGKTLYTQAAYYAIALGNLQLTFDTETRKLIQKKAVLVPIGPNEIQSDKMKKFFKNKLENIHNIETQTVCFIDGAIGGIAPEDSESTLQTLISEAIAKSVNADVVFHSSFNSDSIISNREMTIADLYQLVPYENTIVTADLSPPQITYLIDSMIEHWGTMMFNYPYGLKIKIDVDGLPGERILSICDKNNKSLNPNKKYKVAFNSYVAASNNKESLSIRSLLSKKSSATKNVSLSTRESIRNFLENKKSYKAHSLKIVEHIKGDIGQFVPITQNTILAPEAIHFVEFSYIHPGNRNEELDSEWFVIKNRSKEVVNLKGYSISDEDEGGRFRIKKDVKLAPGETMLFCYNSQQFKKLAYAENPYLRIFEYGKLAKRLNLGNRGDEIMIINSRGNLADQIVYGQRRKIWKNWPAESKAPNHKVGESLIKNEGGWEVNKNPLTTW